MPNNTQKVILITGCSSGFGLLFAARLAAQGHFVYATMRDIKKQQPLLDEVAKRGGQVIVLELDVTKPATIAKVIREIKDRHAHVDVVINNAGYGLGGFFEDLTDAQIRHLMDVNFFGIQNVCREVLHLMRQHKRGLIINISSIAGLTASPCLSAYNASKWAVEGFSESLYYELLPFGIRVVLVEPGSYPTKIFKENAQYAKDFDNPQSAYHNFSQKIKYFVDNNTLKLKVDPEEVAKLVEKIINSRNPHLRYISDISSVCRVLFSKIFPASIYGLLYKKIVYKC